MREINIRTYLRRIRVKKREYAKNKARDKYKNLSEEDKFKKREYAKNKWHNMSRLKENQKKKKQEAKESKHNKSLSTIIYI